jgi:hypothetical protein
MNFIEDVNCVIEISYCELNFSQTQLTELNLFNIWDFSIIHFKESTVNLNHMNISLLDEIKINDSNEGNFLFAESGSANFEMNNINF